MYKKSVQAVSSLRMATDTSLCEIELYECFSIFWFEIWCPEISRVVFKINLTAGHTLLINFKFNKRSIYDSITLV